MNCLTSTDEAARLLLGVATARELILAADRALENGCISPSLIELASSTAASPGTKTLFLAAVAELGETMPSEREAVLRLARAVAAKVLSGEVSAQAGANAIWRLSILPAEPVAALDPFVYAGSEWEERPEDEHLFETMVRAAARDLLAVP